MVNLKAKPYNLDEKAIQWVEDTIANMTIEEKIGQLFINMGASRDEEYLKSVLDNYHIGGVRYNPATASEVYDQNKILQENSKIPLLIAANTESGGNGACVDGTYVGVEVKIAATNDKKYAYELGRVSGVEASAIGCNWSFAPIVDINRNWRSSVVYNRCFSSDSDQVLEMSKEYLRGAKDAGLASCMKHFPGDGLDERDQHVVTTDNLMSCEEWDNEFGKVYKGMIDAGVESVMIGHIRLPEYQRKLKPGIKDNEIMPATIAPELLQGLLREQLGFNGLIITDATHMVGLTSQIRREDMIPTTIAAGCDMILYYRDKDEDTQALKTGLEKGILTMERLDEAVTRVLAFKAMLKLHTKKANGTLIPPAEGLSVVGCEEHKEVAKDIMDKAITLVKNTKNQLPITPQTHKRIMLYTIENGGFTPNKMDKATLQDRVKAELEAQGFEVDVFDNSAGLNGKQLLASTPVKEFVSKYDAVMLFISVTGFSTSNVRRITWNLPMGPEIPWYVTELPTVCVSVHNPFHLIDVPMVPTYINSYSDNDEAIHQVIQKIMGKSEFKGISPVDAFCGAWDTRL